MGWAISNDYTISSQAMVSKNIKQIALAGKVSLGLFKWDRKESDSRRGVFSFLPPTVRTLHFRVVDIVFN